MKLTDEPWQDGTAKSVAHWPKGRALETHVRVTTEGGRVFVDIRDYSPDAGVQGLPAWGQGVWFEATPENLAACIAALVAVRNGETP